MTSVGASTTTSEQAFLTDALRRMAIASAHQLTVLVPLAGGVSSDIYRASAGGAPCVRQTRPTEAEGRGPLGGADFAQRYESAWMRFAARPPHSVPKLLGDDPQAGLSRWNICPRPTTRWWKMELLAGTIDEDVARRPSANCSAPSIRRARARPDLAAGFATDDTFHALRLEPYLLATARAHPDLAPCFTVLVTTTARPGRAGARRRQPEEHSRRAARAGPSGRRVRLVRRPGFRPRLLPQPPAAEMRVAAAWRDALSRASRRLPGLPRGRVAGSRAQRSRRARPHCCRDCSSRAWTANRRSNTSPTKRRTGARASPCAVCEPPPPARRDRAAHGTRPS